MGARRAKRRLTSFRSPLAAFLVALSLIVQLFAAATPPAFAAPAFAGADDAAIAAELKALFGDTAQLCVQVNDDKRSGQARAVRPLLRSVPALPLRRSGRGVCRRLTCRPCPNGSRATRMRFARRLARTFFPPIPPSQIPPGPLPSQSDGHSPTRAFRRAFAFLQTRGLPFMTLLTIRCDRGRACAARRSPVALARLPSRRLRRPHLPFNAGDRRSRRHR